MSQVRLMIDHQALVRSAQDIEPLPASVSRLLTLASGDRWSLQDIEQVVGLDQALTMRLLRAANSILSASAVPIGTIREAVTRLGFATLLSLATGSGVQRRMRGALPEYGLSEGGLWRHSVAAALAADAAQALCTTPIPPETYVAALLHDVGKLVMAQHLDAETLRLLRDARERGAQSSLRAEAEVLEVHHGELGGLLAQQWKLPERVVIGIIHHHTPDQAGDIIADATHVANIAAKRAGTGFAANADDLQLAESSLARLGLTTDGFETLCDRVRTRLDRVIAAYA